MPSEQFISWGSILYKWTYNEVWKFRVLYDISQQRMYTDYALNAGFHHFLQYHKPNMTVSVDGKEQLKQFLTSS